MSPGPELSRTDVETFLAGHVGEVADLEPLAGGSWSSAWGYRTAGEEFVIRFGPELSWYDADRMAMAFDGPDLPVPEVRELGRAEFGSAYAISVRRHGRFLEDTPAELTGAGAATLVRLLVALFGAPPDPDAPVVWHEKSHRGTWRDFLLSGLRDDPANVVHGWSERLATDPKLAALSAAAVQRITTLVAACPQRGDLVHGDLLHGNVLLSPDAGAVEAVLSWKCSVRGDFLFDAAWCGFWAPLHPGIADPLAELLRSPRVRADPAALIDCAARHHCYELHIGVTHLGWNIWTGDEAALAAVAARLAEVLDRGPLPGLS